MLPLESAGLQDFLWHVEFQCSWQLGYFGASVELYSVLDTTNDGTINFEEPSAKIRVVCQWTL